MKKHNSLYRFLSAVTCTALISAVCSATVSASVLDSSGVKQNCITYNRNFYNENSELCDAIEYGMKNMQSEIDVEKYQPSINDIKTAVRTVSETNPEIFYVSKTTFACAMGNYVVKLIPKYIYTSEQVNEMSEKLKNRTREILEKITPEMSDFQKVAIIHDEIALNCEYSNTPNELYTRTSVYDCLVNGYSNCQGYSSSLSYMLEQIGINTEIVESAQMNHIWNLVEIDGNYYHIDVTFDDATPDKFGFVSHKYFLLSDNAIKNSSDISVHYGYKTINTSDSTVYDKSYFKTLNTRFCYINGLCYTADNNYNSDYSKNIILFDPESGFLKPIAKIPDTWYASDGLNYWQDSFISVDAIGESIYFNTNNAVCRYNVSDGTAERITNKIDTSDYTYIYGMKAAEDGKFLVDLKNSPTNSTNIITLEPLPENKYEKLDIVIDGGFSDAIPQYISGDVNDDGIISVLDVTLLQMLCTGSEEASDKKKLAADYNNDGNIDVNDATALQVYLSNHSS